MKKLLVVFLLGFSASAFAQVNNPDSLFDVARELAFAGSYDSCIDLCNEVLQAYPSYEDFTILKARCYNWKGSTDIAEQLLHKLTQQSPKNYDAHSAYTDVLNKEGKHNLQIAACSFALVYFPNNIEFLLKKANAEVATSQDSAAITTLDTLLAYKPKHKAAKELHYRLKTRTYKTYIKANTTHESFSAFYDDRSLSFLEIGSKISPKSTLIGRLNYANRFGLTGSQVEADYYYGIDSNSYVYGNVGYSNAVLLFPESRYGFEYYRFLHKNIRASVGMRYLIFQPDDTTKRTTTIYTGTVSAFYGKYTFTFQPFITPVTSGTVNTYIVKLQRSFNVTDHYLRLEAGSGFSPDSWRNPSLTSQQRINDDAFLLQSHRISLYYQLPIKYKFLLNFQVLHERQELINNQGSFINVLGLTAGIKHRF